MMAKVDLSNFWGSSIDMSGFTDDGWGYVYSGNPTGTLYAGYNSITFNAYGFAQGLVTLWSLAEMRAVT
jgi:hypothetical protein